MEPILLQTSEEDRGARLDAFLARAMEDLTRSAAAKAIEEGRVLVSGKVPSKSLKLTGNETIEFTPEEPAPIDAVPQDIPLNVVYEDDDVIVVNKPSGLVVHPAPGHPDGTLVNALLISLRRKPFRRRRRAASRHRAPHRPRHERAHHRGKK